MKEIVIKIPDEVLSFVYQNGFIKAEDRNTVHHAILECVELPKGHGELITKGQAVALIQFYQQNPQHFSFENLIEAYREVLADELCKLAKDYIHYDFNKGTYFMPRLEGSLYVGIKV